jgi:PAS domain-containing protein
LYRIGHDQARHAFAGGQAGARGRHNGAAQAPAPCTRAFRCSAKRLGGPTEALLDRIIQRSPVGMAVIDHEGRFRVVNPAYGAIFGYRA